MATVGERIAVDGNIEVDGGGGVAELTAVAGLRGSRGSLPFDGSVDGPRLTAKNAMPPSAAAASITAINQTPTLLLRRMPRSAGSMSLTLSSAPKLSVLP